MTKEQVLERVQEAVTDWILESQDGMKAWQDSCEDFNIGDMSTYMDEELVRCLAGRGILAPNLLSPDDSACPAWNYDTVLADRWRVEGGAT